jgi:MoxR-like ATPase
MTADEYGTTRPTPSGWPDVTSPQQLAALLRRVDYLADEGLAAAAFLALRMRRPLFLEGEPGVGKTSFAQKIAQALGARPIRLQCHGGIDASQALYDWNFPRQILTLRAAEDGARNGIVKQLYSWDFLVRRPILEALENGPAVLLIDEIDRADDEFEALLLEVLEANSVSIPELGEIRATIPPLVILTSNRTREVHDALKRRCLSHWIPHPDPDREVEILRQRVAALPDDLARQIADGMHRLRAARDLAKTPGVAESIDLAHALIETGATALTPTALSVTLSTVVKHHDDQAPVRDLLPMRQDPE